MFLRALLVKLLPKSTEINSRPVLLGMPSDIEEIFQRNLPPDVLKRLARMDAQSRKEQDERLQISAAKAALEFERQKLELACQKIALDREKKEFMDSL